MSTKPEPPATAPVTLGVDVTTAPTVAAIVDLITGGIVRMTEAEIDGLDPDTFRRATDRDIAIGE